MIFVDTSAWYASTAPGDRHNAAAKRLIREADRLVTSDHVLVECWLLINSRFGHAGAESYWRRMLGIPLELVNVTNRDLESAWKIAGRVPDQTFSIVDRTSFVVMERLGITRVISFEDDFVIYRYGTNRDRAFEVLR